MRVRYIVLLLVLGSLAYLLLWPTGLVFPSSKFAKAPSLTGVLLPNTELNDLATLGTVGDGPEDIAITADGTIYTGVANGTLFKKSPTDKDWQAITVTYGRPLGLAFDPAEKWLYICDAVNGLMRTDKAGHLERLIDTLNGEDLGLVDDLAVAEGGIVYFTTATTEWNWDESSDAILIANPTGKLMRYNVRTKKLDVLIDDMPFANGVALTPDGKAVLVAETGAYRIKRYGLVGRDSGRVTTFAENLPGFPDGLNYDEEGQLWVSLPSPRIPIGDKLSNRPFWREVTYKLPEQFKPKPIRYGFLIALNADGQIVESLHGPDGKYALMTNVIWKGNTAYISSLEEQSIAVYTR